MKYLLIINLFLYLLPAAPEGKRCRYTAQNSALVAVEAVVFQHPGPVEGEGLWAAPQARFAAEDTSFVLSARITRRGSVWSVVPGTEVALKFRRNGREVQPTATATIAQGATAQSQGSVWVQNVVLQFTAAEMALFEAEQLQSIKLPTDQGTLEFWANEKQGKKLQTRFNCLSAAL